MCCTQNGLFSVLN